MNSLNRDRWEEKETRIELLKKDFVAWRKKWLEEWSINGCPGGENKPDNHYLLFNWFEKKIEVAKASERQGCLEAVKEKVYRQCLANGTDEDGTFWITYREVQEILDQAISAISNKK